MRCACAAALLLALAGCQTDERQAGEQQAETPKHDPHSPTKGATAAQRESSAAMAQMHRTMGAASPDPDESFMRMMIPHHRGAIAMAEIELRHGKDPVARRLAERVIAEQRGEIAEMEAWLAKRAAR
nr:DUF305 domain-containing protein [uncultured Sphingosinicella sp.]